MLSVIVPIYQNSTLVEYCLDVLSQNIPQNAELILVDDASGPRTAALLRRYPRARLIEHSENCGNTVAYNTGAKSAKGDILVFVDSDVFVPAGALDEFERIVSTSNNVGLVGSFLLYPYDYTIQHAGVAFDEWGLAHVFSGRKPAEVPLRRIEERQAVTAAFSACHRRLFEEIGGFNETYRDGLEDIELCLQFRELGCQNLLASRFPALHLESATRGAYKHIRRSFNYSIFFSRWAGRFKPDLNEYLRHAAVAALSHWKPGDHKELVLNFCSTPNWLDLVGVLREFGIDPGDIHNRSGFLAESDPIDLFRMVPLAFQRGPSSIVFVVDHFLQLMRNRAWFRRRPVVDLFADRHGNVMTSERFGFGPDNYGTVGNSIS